MRVIAGAAGRMPLDIPKGVDLRPTMDLVKGAIFSTLGDFIEGTRVLDLFAGTGGLGIEALSRGAASAVFVEKDFRAAEVIRKNLEKTRLPGGEVHQMDIFAYLDRVAPSTGSGPGAGEGEFRVIFADPPYAKQAGERDFTPELLNSESLRRALAPDGFFVLEHLPGQELPLGESWDCTRQKRYGATEVAYLRAK
ncbi:MAG TPA: 16S rRNA (guanine(966)-N(2))-methyltransferase RsmD [Chthoniobacteraceae bacterium]|jgi:16S rRNA (guanine966-N2)-methyltransferase|nr:16S rRNA (guanine(966)-N(2))-methyltransferase RsmD [Chthoniobacteraceae bacterium]